ncbi:MAG: hypothetical protein ABSH31_21535, partial [Bryobacteraceae bacterium]
MKPESALAALPRFADVTSHVLREHAAGGIDAIDGRSARPFATQGLLAKRLRRNSVRLHEVQARNQPKLPGKFKVRISFLDFGSVVTDANEIEPRGARGAQILALADPR